MGTMLRPQEESRYCQKQDQKEVIQAHALLREGPVLLLFLGFSAVHHHALHHRAHRR
jgi:hypothetical protein